MSNFDQYVNRAAESTRQVIPPTRLDTPLGQAEAATQQRQGFLELQMQVGASQSDVTFFLNGVRDKQTNASQAGVLSAVEGLGWRLIQVNYLFVPTAEVSRSNFIGSAVRSAVSGTILGVYLFRNSNV